MDQLRPPENFAFENPDLAYKWKNGTLYPNLVGKTDEKERNVKLLLYLIGSEGWESYETIQFEPRKRTEDSMNQFSHLKNTVTQP